MISFSNKEFFDVGELSDYVVEIGFTTPTFYGTGDYRLEIIKLKMIQGTKERTHNLLEAPPGPYGPAVLLPAASTPGTYDIPMEWFEPFDNGDIKLELYWARYSDSRTGKLADIGTIKLEPNKMSISNTLGELIASIVPSGIKIVKDTELKIKVPCEKIYNLPGYPKITFFPTGTTDIFNVKQAHLVKNEYYKSDFTKDIGKWVVQDTLNNTALIQKLSMSSVFDSDTLTTGGTWKKLKNTDSDEIKIPMNNICSVIDRQLSSHTKTVISGSSRLEGSTSTIRMEDTAPPIKVSGPGIELRNGSEVWVNAIFNENATLDIPEATTMMEQLNIPSDTHEYQIDELTSGTKTYSITVEDDVGNRDILEPITLTLSGSSKQEVTIDISQNGTSYTISASLQDGTRVSADNIYVYHRLVELGGKSSKKSWPWKGDPVGYNNAYYNMNDSSSLKNVIGDDSVTPPNTYTTWGDFINYLETQGLVDIPVNPVSGIFNVPKALNFYGSSLRNILVFIVKVGDTFAYKVVYERTQTNGQNNGKETNVKSIVNNRTFVIDTF